MIILGLDKIIKLLKIKIEDNKIQEHGVIGIAKVINENEETILKIKDFAYLNNLSDNLNKLYISPETSLKLLINCSKNKEVPIIAHSHVYYKRGISYSIQDINFMNSFLSVGNKIGNIKIFLFLLSNGNENVLRVYYAEKFLEIRGRESDFKKVEL